MSLKNQNFYFWSLPCGSMSKVSKIVTTTLNALLSPLKTLNFTLFQNLKKKLHKAPQKWTP
jgi:hypothetical protein